MLRMLHASTDVFPHEGQGPWWTSLPTRTLVASKRGKRTPRACFCSASIRCTASGLSTKPSTSICPVGVSLPTGRQETSLTSPTCLRFRKATSCGKNGTSGISGNSGTGLAERGFKTPMVQVDKLVRNGFSIGTSSRWTWCNIFPKPLQLMARHCFRRFTTIQRFKTIGSSSRTCSNG